MRNALLGLFFLCTHFFTQASATSPVGESASYILNDSDRTSWLIQSGKATAYVMSAQVDPNYGPGYQVELDYEVDVLFKGTLKGRAGLLVPERVFEEGFAQELALNRTIDVGGFSMDYLGLSDAEDANGTLYEQCTVARVYNIDPNYRPTPAIPNGIFVLYHNAIGPQLDVNDLQIIFKVAPNIPVLGAVQLDISGRVLAFDIRAGFDYQPNN